MVRERKVRKRQGEKISRKGADNKRGVFTSPVEFQLDQWQKCGGPQAPGLR